MNVLECFSGTGSVKKCCDELGWNVISVDIILVYVGLVLHAVLIVIYKILG